MVLISRFVDLVVIAERLHSIPFRTRTLRAPAPMVLCLKAWESRTLPGLQNVKILSLYNQDTSNYFHLMNFLVTGGAGYIGSHMVSFLQRKDFNPVVLDNFSTGKKCLLKNCEILNADLTDKKKLSVILNNRKFDAVFHFAAKSTVSDSFLSSKLYFNNNVDGTKNLVEEMKKNKNEILIFSSSAAVYGNPITKLIKEEHPKNPISPYGESKLLCEEFLASEQLHKNFNYCNLRYFNAAGADNLAEIGEYRDKETHLIPQVLNSIRGSHEPITIYGNDYDTFDGTCVRDFIHVCDLVEAHYEAFKKIRDEKKSFTYNLANEEGFSVLDIIKVCEKITKKKINYSFGNRRKGDPSTLIADCQKARDGIFWNPSKSNIENIVTTAWKWHASLK